MTPEEEATLYRWITRFFLACFLFLLAILPLARSGFFRKQLRLKEARALIERGGYAYCAIWGDGTDPFQLTSLNSPLRPNWQGDVQPDGSYHLVFTYRRSGKSFRHEWNVNLPEKRVIPSDEEAHTPIGTSEGQMQCRE